MPHVPNRDDDYCHTNRGYDDDECYEFYDDDLLQSDFVYSTLTPLAAFVVGFFICCCYACCNLGGSCWPSTKTATFAALRFVDLITDWLFFCFSVVPALGDPSYGYDCPDDSLSVYSAEHDCCAAWGKSFDMPYCRRMTNDCTSSPEYSKLGYSCETSNGDLTGATGFMRVAYWLPLATLIVCILSTLLTFAEMLASVPCVRVENDLNEEKTIASRSNLAMFQMATLLVEDIPQLIFTIVFLAVAAGVEMELQGKLAAALSLVFGVISLVLLIKSTHKLTRPENDETPDFVERGVPYDESRSAERDGRNVGRKPSFSAVTKKGPSTNAEPQDISGFRVSDIGRAVIVKGVGSGTLRFVGLNPLNGEPRVGVEYNKPKGTHGGTVKNVRYFECDAGKGTLPKPSSVYFTDVPQKTAIKERQQELELERQRHLEAQRAYVREETFDGFGC